MSDKMYNVKNRSASLVVYSVPQLHVRREFAPGQSLKIGHEELEKLAYQDGGKYLIANYLQILDAEELEKLDIETEPEYSMSEKDVIELIKNGSIDEFKDAMDFAPTGVIELIKELAVSLPMNDAEKRNYIKETTGFDVDSAIRHINEDKEEEQEGAPTVKKTRRVNKNTTTSKSSGRRAEPKKYEVVSDKED